MKILDVLHKFYGDFEFIKEKCNEKYEGILINIKEDEDKEYKRCRLAKRTPKKKDILQHFGKKTKITRTFLIPMKIWELNLLSLSSIMIKRGYLLFQTKLLFVRKFSRQKTAKEKCPCDFIRLGAQI